MPQQNWHPESRGDQRFLQGPGQRRGYSEPTPRRTDVESEASSDFTYVTFDAQTITVPISVCVAIMVG